MINYDKRDEIIFGTPYLEEEYIGGIRHFEYLRRYQLIELMDKDMFRIYPWLRYAEYWWFLERFDRDEKLFLHGFTYSKERCSKHKKKYSGIILEGIGRDEEFNDKETEKVFKFLFGKANEFRLKPPWAWFD